jgi:Zn-dependent protease
MSGFRVGRIAGIELRVHPSWFVILLLVVWILAHTALPADYPDMHAPLRLGLAAGIALAFFASLLAHELAHSMVALARGIPVHSITFFLFGGMAQTSRDSRSPREEFLIAAAGPTMSLALALAFLSIWWLGAGTDRIPVLVGAAGYVGALNLVLAVFNMLPGFPMDGGRILRAAIWAASGDVTRATLWASRVGQWMALILVAYGVWRVSRGDRVGGTWLALIGLFIGISARSSYQQFVIARTEATLGPGWEAGPTQGGT